MAKAQAKEKTYTIGLFERAIAYYQVSGTDPGSALSTLFHGHGSFLKAEHDGDPVNAAGIAVEDLDPETRERLIQEGYLKPTDWYLPGVASIVEDEDEENSDDAE